jgi:hypothetical protein
MKFAAVVGHRSGRATPSLRDAPQRQSMETVGWETIYRNRNAVQTKLATSEARQKILAIHWATERGCKPIDDSVASRRRSVMAAFGAWDSWQVHD